MNKISYVLLNIFYRPDYKLEITTMTYYGYHTLYITALSPFMTQNNSSLQNLATKSNSNHLFLSTI